jgi:hypothetical protein
VIHRAPGRARGPALASASSRRFSRAILAGLVALLAAACGGEAPKADPAPGPATTASSGVSGRFRMTHENGVSEFVLEEKDGVVTITSNGETTTGRVTSPGRVEGKEESADGSGTFVFDVQGDRLVARFTLKGPSGETVEVPELTFTRVTEGAAAAGAASSTAAAASGARDARIHGHWRHTEARASGGFTMATDYHLVLEPDGRFASWSRTEGSAGSSTGERVTGAWEAEDGVLRLRADGGDGWAESRYQISGDTLLRTYPSGDKQVFERL